MRKVHGALLLVAAACGNVADAAYDKNSAVPLATAMTTQCKLGDAPLSKGSTPTSIAGVTVVSPQQARCLIDRYSDALLVIGAMSDQEQLPDAWPVPVLARDKEDADFTKAIETDLTPLTLGNRARPILIYCHHASCQYSANGAQHLVNLGYTRVYWLRDGTAGWQEAGYAFAAKPRLAPGVTQSFASFNEARKYTYGCFGEQNYGACARKTGLEFESYTAADVKPGDRPVILGTLLNTIAVFSEILRTGGEGGKQTKDPAKGLALAQDGMKLLQGAVADGSYPNGYDENLKLQQEVTLALFEAGRPADAQGVLREARAVADRRFTTLGAVRGDKDKRQAVLSTMVSAEKLERAVWESAGARATALYQAGKTADAAKYRDLAQPAYARGATWIVRNSKEGVAGFADQSPEQRLATLKLGQADMLLASGDKPAATNAYRAARATSCPFVTADTRAEIEAKRGVSDIFQLSLARDCQRAERGEMRASGELDRQVQQMSDAILRQQYAQMGLDYDAIKKKNAK